MGLIRIIQSGYLSKTYHKHGNTENNLSNTFIYDKKSLQNECSPTPIGYTLATRPCSRECRHA